MSFSRFVFLHGTLLLYAVSSVFAKLAGNALYAGETMRTIVYIGVEFLLLGIYAILWQQVLKRMPLSFAYTNKAICTLWTVLFAIFCFGETLTLAKAIGVIIVLVGIGVVVSEK